jgi:hypothetical protein
MACKQCRKKITGNFICLNIGAGALDKTKTSTNLPKGLTQDVWFDVMSHSDNRGKYKTAHIFKKMEGNVWGVQMEEYFCSKACLMKWFEKQLKNIPDP